MFTPVQAALLATIAQVTPRQHEPVEIGQRFGRHVVPSPRKVLGARHAVRATMVHDPPAAQHPPVGWMQITAAQVVPAPMNMPGQSEETVTEQVPSEKQQAPVAVEGQGLGVQGTANAQLEMPEQSE